MISNPGREQPNKHKSIKIATISLFSVRAEFSTLAPVILNKLGVKLLSKSSIKKLIVFVLASVFDYRKNKFMNSLS